MTFYSFLLKEKAELKKELEEEFRAQLEDNAKEMEAMKKAFEQKLKEARENDSEVRIHHRRYRWGDPGTIVRTEGRQYGLCLGAALT